MTLTSTRRKVWPWLVPVLSAVAFVPAPPVGEDTSKDRTGLVEARARNFWAFTSVVRPPMPELRDATWVRNSVDAFVLAKLRAAGLEPAPPADKTTLLRRAYYAVTGLPPTPAEVDGFLADGSSDAYDKVVDRLLESRHYGEHWARHWLDLVRYAETNSFERDGAKPFAWRYRDYVIRSFNDDKPYDQFIREQLAGDELDAVTPDTIVATGYYRLGTWDDEPVDREQVYYDELDDVLATTGQTFLGLTVNCGRCHDHKIDPFSQRDYYRLLAFFHGVRRYDNGPGSLRPIGPEDEQRQHRQELDEHKRKLAEIDRQLAAIEDTVRPQLEGGERDDFKHEANRVAILKKHVPDVVSEQTIERYQSLHKERDHLRKNPPPAGAQGLCVTEDGPRDTFVLVRGSHRNRGEQVGPGFPTVLTVPDAPAPTISPPPQAATTCGRRRVLADWIADPTNQLTARVMVNRVWQYQYGRGIVRSASNFGYGGTPPTHPELLDWLASEFVARGWRLKPLHRLLLTSNTFRMSSVAHPSALSKDPENDLLSHFDLRRLSAEELRDSVLAVCGNLDRHKTEGPSVYPVIPPEVLAGQSQPGNGWGKSTPEEAAARSVFVHIKRSLTVPTLAAFDAADTDSPCPVRNTTTQPTQALALLNSEFANSQAKVFADDLRKQSGDGTAQVRLALARVLQRIPTESEVARGVRFIRALCEKDALPPEEALRRFCLLAVNLNEFVFLE